MTKAIRFHETGGPEVLLWEDIDVGKPAPGQVRLRHTAIGLNYIDTYQRSGLYPLELPLTLGMEAAGIVEELGEGVVDLAVGDRVAYASPPLGSYAEKRLMPADRVVKVPAGISDKHAAAMMLQGMTVEYLLRRTYPVRAGETILVHAAAGGVGLIMCQWAHDIGATVIGTVGSSEKADIARAHGCDHAIIYTEENFKEKVRELTDGKGVPVVYDSIGKDTFDASIDCLATRGLMVSFGNASGPVPPYPPAVLGQKGSLFLTRPSLMNYTATRAELVDSAQALFDIVGRGAVKIVVNQTYPLAEAAQAHRDIEGRRTTGSTIFLP